MSANPYQTFGLSCPNGGDFHICENTKREFVGCCTTDPCADGSGLCDKAHLRAASFSGSSYLDIPPQSCESPGGDDHFYTCTANDPPFIGCCTINPCVNMTCPPANLRAAVLSSDHDDRASFLTPSASTRGGQPPEAAAGSSSDSLSSGAVAGIVVGIIAFLILVAGVVVAWRRYRWNLPFKSTKSASQDNLSLKSANEALMESPKTPRPGHANPSASSTHWHSQPSDPRSAFYSSASFSPLPLYSKQCQSPSPANQHSPDGQSHTPQTTKPPRPTFPPPRGDSRTWPFQSPLHEPTHPSASPKPGLQKAWPGHQPVHELLAEVQRPEPEPEPELPAEERAQELRSSYVVQPLRSPPPAKRRVSDVMPDSPTLGPPSGTGWPASPKAPAALGSRPASRPRAGGQGAQEECRVENPRPRQAGGRDRRDEQSGVSYDSTNFI